MDPKETLEEGECILSLSAESNHAWLDKLSEMPENFGLNGIESLRGAVAREGLSMKVHLMLGGHDTAHNQRSAGFREI